jgi:hypothetical protein
MNDNFQSILLQPILGTDMMNIIYKIQKANFKNLSKRVERKLIPYILYGKFCDTNVHYQKDSYLFTPNWVKQYCKREAIKVVKRNIAKKQSIIWDEMHI